MSSISLISEQQRKELNKAILAYLSSIPSVKNEVLLNLEQALDLPSQGKLNDDNNASDKNNASDPNTESNENTSQNQSSLFTNNNLNSETWKKYKGILEKKWTAIVRLQKKIFDLESQVHSLQSELENNSKYNIKRAGDVNNWLPHVPAKLTLNAHRSPVLCVAFHPVYSSVASGSEDCTIRIWDWELGECEKVLRGHTRPVTSVDFGKCSSISNGTIISNPKTDATSARAGADVLLASCSSDLTVRVWDASNDYACIRTLTGHEHTISCVRFATLFGLSLQSNITDSILFSASRDKSIKVWDTRTGYCLKTLQGHSEWIKSISISEDSSILASAGSDKTARIWDIRDIQNSYYSSSSSLSPITNNNNNSLSINKSTLSISSPTGSSNRCTAILIGHEHVIEAVEIAPKSANKYFYKIAGIRHPNTNNLTNNNQDNQSRLNNNNQFSHINESNQLSDNIYFIATAGRDRTVRLWDSKGNILRILYGHDNWVRGITFHPSGRYLLSCAEDGSIRCWDLSSVEVRCVRVLSNAHDLFVTCIRWATSVLDPSYNENNNNDNKNGNINNSNTNDKNNTNDKILNSNNFDQLRSNSKNHSNAMIIRCVVATGSSNCEVKIWMP